MSPKPPAPGSRMQGRQALIEILRAIPAGRVATREHVSAQLGIDGRALLHLLEALTEAERAECPWHRVVAAGGAIGRHPRFAEQIERLRADGVAVSPAGIVQDMPRRLGLVADPAPASPGGGRARGAKSRPTSSI